MKEKRVMNVENQQSSGYDATKRDGKHDAWLKQIS
jgi:hypothetical protein